MIASTLGKELAIGCGKATKYVDHSVLVLEQFTLGCIPNILMVKFILAYNHHYETLIIPDNL